MEFVMSASQSELIEIFQNPWQETTEGVIAIGGKLTTEALIQAYAHGIFPWPHEGYPLLWFCPEERGILDFKDLHLPKSFKKWLRQKEDQYEIKINTQFSEVIKQCRLQKRSGQAGSWINKEIEKSYCLLHDLGFAISLEVSKNQKLVAGIYGVQSKKYFSCESMFHLEPNTSKLALYKLTQYLADQQQTWMDIQMVTSVCDTFGGKLISKKVFLKRIGL